MGDYEEVLHQGQDLISASRRGTGNVVDVMKHSSLGIAVVTLCSADKRVQLLSQLDKSSQTEGQFTLQIGGVVAEVKAHKDKETAWMFQKRSSSHGGERLRRPRLALWHRLLHVWKLGSLQDLIAIPSPRERTPYALPECLARSQECHLFLVL